MKIIKKHSFARAGIVLAVGAMTLTGCSSDRPSTNAVSAQSTDETPTSAVAESSETGAGATTSDAAETTVDITRQTAGAAGGSLAADSKTCVALGRVKALNDESAKIAAKITNVEEGGSAEEQGKQFEKAVGEFKSEAGKFIPDLNAAYDDLATEQPQFKDDLTNLKEVTVEIFKAMGDMKGDDLARFPEIIAAAAPQEKLIAAGEASLKIDKFSKESCGIPFANT
jgi:hypothetical protein